MVHEGVQWFGPLSTNLAIPVGTPNAAFVTQSVPTTMVQGLTYPVSVTMQNTGNLTWHPGQHYLRSQNAQDNTRWGPSRIELANAVPPGQSVTFNFNAAPASSGTLDFQWRMADGAVSFGSASTNVPVAVDVPQNAQFVSQLVPSAMAPGGTYLVRVTMRNNGSTTWSAAAGFKLGSQNPEDNTTWGSRVPLPHDVAPGEDVAFMFSVTAPSASGNYNFQWKMLREGFAWFGASSTNVAVAVGPIQDRVHYIHADHLNTPRLVADAAATTVWKWDQQEPFGNNPADENPSGLGAFDLPLRLPGQYFDKETNLHYNYHRDYDPSIGRYGESDPIGLIGGLNTYAYVAGSPLHASDELGLFYGNEAAYATRVPVAGPAAVVAGAFLGGVAIGTAIYNEYGEQIQDALEKICRPEKSSDHRGRIQAQGNTTGPDVNVSSAWAQKYPLTKGEGFAHLHRTVIQIPPRQLPRFTNAISKAASFIQSTSTQTAPFDKSFYQNWRQSARRGAERIDIQIFSGEAF